MTSLSKMDVEGWHPNNFKMALGNTFTDEEVTDLLYRTGTSARFVYGILKLPTALRYYLEIKDWIPIEKSMTQATLHGYQLYRICQSGPPVICKSSNPVARVEGMLIFDLQERERNALYDFEAGLLNLTSVQVEILQESRDGIRTRRMVDAGAFVWSAPSTGLIFQEDTSWSVDAFLRSQFYGHIEASQRRS